MYTKIRNKVVRALLMLFLLAFLLGNVQTAKAVAPAISVNGCVMIINSDGSGGLAVRSGPGTSYPVLKRISDGTVAKILEGPRSGNGYTWWRHDKGGWSASAYMSDKSCQKSVVLDAGHGGSDPGAVANGLKEKDINLDVTLKVKAYLESKGVAVYLTRSGDTNPTLTQRAQVCNDKKPYMMVSIHTNAGGGTGPEAYYSAYFKTKSTSLATVLPSTISSYTSMRNRGAKNGDWLGVLKCQKAPSSLVELAFIDAPSQYRDLHYLKYDRQTLANAVGAAIWTELNR